LATKLHLPNVTLFATDGPTIHLTLRSFEYCYNQVSFGDAILFSEVGLFQKPYKVVKINSLGSARNSGIHSFNNLPSIMETSHALFIEWDSWILAPELWSNELLNYDYIGARWPWKKEGKNIGNSGFCLISKKLLSLLKEKIFSEESIIDDEIGDKFRPELEKDGVIFAPSEIADKFSYERSDGSNTTFGFHGLFNFWKHVSDQEMINLIPLFSEKIVMRKEYVELMWAYLNAGKNHIVAAMKDRREEFNNQPLS